MAADNDTTWREFHHTVKGIHRACQRQIHRRDPESKENDLTDGDYAHMRKVVGYPKRHLAQRPSSDLRDTAWRYSLMNWGHDPTKK